MAPVSIDGTDIVEATIDGTSVSQITVDGTVVFDPSFSPAAVVYNPDSNDLDNFTGDLSNATINNTAPVSSNSGLSIKLTGGPARIISQSGLSRYPRRGDEFSTRLQIDNDTTAFVQTLFNIQDSNNFFLLGIGGGGNPDKLNIAKKQSGSFTNLAVLDLTIPFAEVLTLNAKWQSSDNLTFEVYREGDTPEDNTPFKSLSSSITPFGDGSGGVATGIGHRFNSDSDDRFVTFDAVIRQTGL
jgi:hypothetical protein